MRVILAATLVISVTPAHGEEDFQTWNYLSFRMLQNENGYFVTTAHFRLVDDSSDPALYRIGQAIIINPVRWLQAGLAYRFTESKNRSGLWRHQHRGEFQLTPRFWLTNDIHFGFRNRLELRWNEDAPNRNERSRHRVRFSVRTPRWYYLRETYGGSEIIVDYDRGEISENRAVPLGFLFRLNDTMGLRTFYMFRSQRIGSDWIHSHVLGTGFSFYI